MSDNMKAMKEVCRIMDRRLFGVDRYIADCIAWLAARGEVTIAWDGDSYVVRGPNFTAGDERLADALTGAVLAADTAESEKERLRYEEWKRANPDSDKCWQCGRSCYYCDCI